MKQGLLFILLFGALTTLAQSSADRVEGRNSKVLFRSDPIIEPSVVFGPTGALLYFSRKGATFNFGKANNTDIWMAYAKNEDLQWNDPINLGPQVNSGADEQVVSINIAADRLYLTKLVHQQMQLFSIEKQGRRWTNKKRVFIPGLEVFHQVKSIFVSSDEQTLLLCAVQDSLNQQADIYYAIKGVFDQWSVPTLLPLPMNKSGDEYSVFLAADNQSLYFASNGLDGLGGYDLFYCKKENNSWDSWSKPQNMGADINTKANEYGLSMPLSGKKMAYISHIMGNKAKIFQLITPDIFQPDSIRILSESEEKNLHPSKGFNH